MVFLYNYFIYVKILLVIVYLLINDITKILKYKVLIINSFSKYYTCCYYFIINKDYQIYSTKYYFCKILEIIYYKKKENKRYDK